MKVKREDLGKLITLLQELYDSNKPIIDIDNAFNTTISKVDTFELPKKWICEPCKDDVECLILYNYMHSGLVEEGDHWDEIEYGFSFSLNWDGVGRIQQYKPDKNVISFEEFKEHIIDKKVKLYRS